MPQTLDHLEDNIRRVIADIRPQMLEKVIENWTFRLVFIRSSRGSPMPEIIFKMGDSRLCVDYRQLNRKLVNDRFPLPLIDDVLDRLQEAKVYTTLDLKNGFFSY
ncbi:retrovirus-related Pol polyprotein from transposon 17.6 [Trichonephila clavipes]|nr:retrovirus-related Pol polyprotein from transposon 17.6 [Trichonephila clavipes]